jgi:transcriptional regulator with XRE-family HTH domain
MAGTVPGVRTTSPPPASELGHLLRFWRRTRRMSQLDLANHARTTSRYVSFVETGRANPSRDMVARLAGALDVPFRERNALLVAAGFAPHHRELPLDSAALRHVSSALDTMLAHHEPFPAVVMDRGWTIRHANAGAVRLFSALLSPLPLPEPANVLRLMIGPGPVRDSVLNWPAVVTALGRARREAVGGVLDPVFFLAPDDRGHADRHHLAVTADRGVLPGRRPYPGDVVVRSRKIWHACRERGAGSDVPVGRGSPSHRQGARS